MRLDTKRTVLVELGEDDAKEFREDLECHRNWAIRALKAKRTPSNAADSEVVETVIAWHVLFAAVEELQALVMAALRAAEPS